MAARKKAPPDPLERLRALILALPETSEKISHGMPTWWGGKKNTPGRPSPARSRTRAQ